MTRQRSFKRLVRTRMEKTGESYTAARASLLGADEPKGIDGSALAPPRRRFAAAPGRAGSTGSTSWTSGARPSGPTARSWASSRPNGHGTGGWSAQAVTVSYERARGLREVGQRPSGFSVTAQKTVAVPVDRLYDAFVDESLRGRWLPDAELRERTATKPKSARFDWGDGTTRVIVGFESRGEAKSTAALEHERLADAEEAKRMKAFWRERVTTLKEVLER